MPRTPESVFRLTGFRGVRAFPDGDRFLDPREARSAQNVITSHGTIETRPGFTVASSLDATNFIGAEQIKYITSLPFIIGNITGVIFAYAGSGENHYWALWNWGMGQPSPFVSGQLNFDEAPPSSFYPQAISHDGVIYVAAGSKQILGIDEPNGFKAYYIGGGEWQVARLGVSAPSTAVRAEMLPPGELGPVGEFTYRFTWANPRTGTEGAPSPDDYGDDVFEATNYINNPGPPQSVFLEGDWRAVGLDPQIRQVRIYRRELDVDPAWYLLDKVDRIAAEGIWQYQDTTPADQLTKTFETELDLVATIPPRGNLLAVHGRRMWWTAELKTNEIRYSEADKPERVDPRNEVRCGSADDPITGLFSAFGKLIVFKQRSIYAVSGGLPASFTVSKLTGSGGCISAATIKEIQGMLYFAGVDAVYRLDAGGVHSITASHGDSWMVQNFYRLAGGLQSLTAAVLPWANLYVLNGLDTAGNYHQWGYDYLRQTWIEWTLPLTAITERPTTSATVLLGGYGQELGQLKQIGYMREYLDTDYFAETQPILWRWETIDMEMRTRQPKKFYHLGLSLTAKAGSADDEIEPHIALGGSNDLTSLGLRPLLSAQPASFRIGAISDSLRVRVAGAASTRVRLHAIDVSSEIVGYRPHAMKAILDAPGRLNVVPGSLSYSIHSDDDYVETEAGRWTVSNVSETDISWYARLVQATPLFVGLHFSVPTEEGPAILIAGNSFELPVMLKPAAFDFPVGQYFAQLIIVNVDTGQQIDRTLTLNVLAGAGGELTIEPDTGHHCEGYAGDEHSFEPRRQDYLLSNAGGEAIHVTVEVDIQTLVCWEHNLAEPDFYLEPGESRQFRSEFDQSCAAAQPAGAYSGRLLFHWGVGNMIELSLDLQVHPEQGNGPDENGVEVVREAVEPLSYRKASPADGG